MVKTKHDKATSEFLVTISAAKDLWKSEQEKAFKKLASELNLKGFRKGQVPIEIARKSISQSSIFSHAVQKVADILVKETEKHIDKSVSVLDSPSFRIEKISADELELTFVFPVYPEIKMGNYKDHGVELEVLPLKEGEVDLEITRILSGRAKVEPKTTGELEKGDFAIFDFKGFVDGKAFEGGEAENYELEMGSGQFIAGFEDQMIGMKIGDERHVVAQFPIDYPAKELSGKQAVFVVKLRGMKRRNIPKLTDEIVASLKINGVKNSKELHNYLEDTLKQRNTQNARERFQQQVFDVVRKDMQATLPRGLVDKESHAQEAQFANNLRRQQMDVKQYLKMTGQSEASLKSYFINLAERRLRDALIFSEIGRLEDIKVVEKDYENMYERYSKIYGQTIDATKGVLSKAQLQIPLMNEKVIDFLISVSKPAKKTSGSKELHDHKHEHAGHDHKHDHKHEHAGHDHKHEHAGHDHKHEHAGHDQKHDHKHEHAGHDHKHSKSDDHSGHNSKYDNKAKSSKEKTNKSTTKSDVSKKK